jgi:hypothetical protein
MDEEGGFKGVWMTATLWLNKDLNWTEKALIAEIDCLCKRDGPCRAGIEHLAERMNLSPGAAANMLSDLTRAGHLIQLGSDGRHVWRCTAPAYWQDAGMVQKWEERFSGRLHQTVNSGLISPLPLGSSNGDTELLEELPEETLRSSDRTSFSQNNSEHNGFSATPKKKKKLNVESVLKDVPADLTLRSPSFAAAWKRWVENRLQLPKPTLGAFQIHMSKCAVLGERRAIAAINESIASSWSSIYEAKLTAKKYAKPEPSL